MNISVHHPLQRMQTAFHFLLYLCFTGLFIPDLKDKVWPDDIETTGQMKERARRFLNWIKKEYPGKTVLAVGHGIINKAVQSVHLGKPMNEIPKMMNADVRIIML